MIARAIAIADKQFIWTQSIALSTWTVPHNLNKRVSVTVVDSNSYIIAADVVYVDLNIVQIVHGTPITGSVFCN